MGMAIQITLTYRNVGEGIFITHLKGGNYTERLYGKDR